MDRASSFSPCFVLALAFALTAGAQEKQPASIGEAFQSATTWARGSARLMAGDYDGAIADYTLILNNEPKSAPALKYRADAFYERGKRLSAQGDRQRMNEDYARSLADI